MNIIPKTNKTEKLISKTLRYLAAIMLSSIAGLVATLLSYSVFLVGAVIGLCSDTLLGFPVGFAGALATVIAKPNEFMKSMTESR